MGVTSECKKMSERVCASNGTLDVDDVELPTRLLRTNRLAREWLLRRSPTDARSDAPLTAAGVAASSCVTMAVQCVDSGQLAMQVNVLLAPHSSINGATFGYALVDYVVAKFICEPLTDSERLNARFLLDELSGELVLLSWNKAGTLTLLWFTTASTTHRMLPGEGHLAAAGGARQSLGMPMGAKADGLASDFQLRELVIFDAPPFGVDMPTKVLRRVVFRPPRPCPPCRLCMERCQGACTKPTQGFGQTEPCSPSPEESWGSLPAQAEDDAAAVAAAAAAAAATATAAAATASFAAAPAAVGPEDLRLTDTCSSLSSAAHPEVLSTDPWEVPEPLDPDKQLDLAVEWDRAANVRFDDIDLVLPSPGLSSFSNVSSGGPPPGTKAGRVDSSDCPEADLVAQLQRSVLNAKAGSTAGPTGGVLTSPTNFLGFAAAVALFQSSSHTLMCGLWEDVTDGSSRMVARALVGVYSSSAEDQQSLRIRASDALSPTLGVPTPPLSSPPPGSSDFVRAVPLLARLLRQQHRAGTVDAGTLSSAERSALAAVSGGADLSTAVATLAGLLSVEGAPLLLASALEDEADGGSRSGSGSGSGSGGGAQSVRAAGATASVRGRGGTGGAPGSVDQSDVLGDDGTGKKRRRARKNLEELAHNTILYNRAIRNRESARRSNERRKQRRQAARSGAAAGDGANGAGRVDVVPDTAGVFLPVGSPSAVASDGAIANGAADAVASAAAAAAAFAAATVATEANAAASSVPPPAAPLPEGADLAVADADDMLLLESALLSEPQAGQLLDKSLGWPDDYPFPAAEGALYHG